MATFLGSSLTFSSSLPTFSDLAHFVTLHYHYIFKFSRPHNPIVHFENSYFDKPNKVKEGVQEKKDQRDSQCASEAIKFHFS